MKYLKVMKKLFKRWSIDDDDDVVVVVGVEDDDDVLVEYDGIILILK